MTRLERRFRRISRNLSNAELMRGSMDERFGSDDLMAPGSRRTQRFLDFYGDEGLRLVLDRFGFIDALTERGYPEICLETSASDERHTLFVVADVDGERERIVELVARRDHLVPHEKEHAPPRGPWEVLTIEWLTMRHPRGRFTPERPRLPGQDEPGLGLGENVLELLYRAVERLRLDALCVAAAHFHLAVLYSQELRFLDPWYGGQLLALERSLMLGEALSLAQASWAIEWGLVRQEDGSTFKWQGHPQIWPHARRLRRWFGSSEYRDACAENAVAQRFELDRDAFDARWADEEPALTGRA